MEAPFSPADVEQLKVKLASKSQQLLIGGKWQDALSGETIDVIDPSTDEKFASIASGGRADSDLAIKAARKAFDEDGWPYTSPEERQRLILRLADLMEENATELALLETLDNGMPFMMARFGSVGSAISSLRYAAGWATKLEGSTMTPSWPGEFHTYTLREPVGVVGAIVPWNFPLAMAGSKVGPALATGCTVVLKPAEQTSLSAIRLVELVQEAGIPDGVVNLITGYGDTAGAQLADSPLVDKVSFTGSTVVGQKLVSACAGNLKKLSLELGGKSPTIIYPDANLEKAIPGAAMAVFNNAGQICVAGSRLFVHEAVFDQVMEGIKAVAASIKVGPGLDPTSQVGPLISTQQLERVLGYVQSGQDDGASILQGGGRIGDTGNFVEPTIFTQASADMKIMREEIFGPVVCANKFSNEDVNQIAALANDTDYGLAANVWTENISTAHKLARRIKAGTVAINGGGPPDPALPFGGSKLSGLGRENGQVGVEAFTELKTVTISL